MELSLHQNHFEVDHGQGLLDIHFDDMPFVLSLITSGPSTSLAACHRMAPHDLLRVYLGTT